MAAPAHEDDVPANEFRVSTARLSLDWVQGELLEGVVELELARELQNFVKKNTAPHKYPRAVIFADSLPKTATGKIKRYKLREMAAEETPLHGR